MTQMNRKIVGMKRYYLNQSDIILKAILFQELLLVLRQLDS